MGIECGILRVSDDELVSYLDNNDLFTDRIRNEKLFIWDDPDYLDLEKCWDDIFYMLTGYSFVNSITSGDLTNLGSILFSGQLIDEELDTGYGPPHYLTSEQLPLLQKGISTITYKQFLERFNPDYRIQTEPAYALYSKDEFEYIYNKFKSLQEFTEKAVYKNQGLITYLN